MSACELLTLPLTYPNPNQVRGSWMVETFLAGAKKRFKKVRAVSRDTLPPAFRRDHIELYELVR